VLTLTRTAYAFREAWVGLAACLIGCPALLDGIAEDGCPSVQTALVAMPQERPDSPHVVVATKESTMPDKDRVEGSAKNMGGKLKEGVGKLTGNSKSQSEGKADQAEGKVQNTIGGVKDTVKDAYKKD